MVAAVGDDDVKVICLELRVFDKLLDDLGHIQLVERAHDADGISLIMTLRLFQLLGDADQLRVKLLGGVEAVAGSGEVKDHDVFLLLMYRCIFM